MRARGRLPGRWAATSACLASAALALAQGYPDAKILPDDAAAGIGFGSAVSAHDNVVAVGANLESSVGYQAGAVYVFLRDGEGWLQDAKLTASDGARYDEFGYAVALHGDCLVVGAPYQNAVGLDSGAAYVFRREGGAWVEEAKLVPSDGGSLDWFGQAVAVGEDWVLVGAPQDDDAGLNAGAVYVFHYDGTGWVEYAKLTASAGVSGAQFGAAVAMDGPVALIGAPLEGAGAAYVYWCDAGDWAEEGRITASDGASGDRFGAAVAARDESLLVGAPRYDSPLGLNIGAAYVFQREGVPWVEVARLTASDAAPADYFGNAVAVDGGCAVVGAHYGDVADINSGAAYVYRVAGDAWTEEAKLTAGDGGLFDWFGSAVALADDEVLVGANGDDAGGENAGAAYVFTLAAQQNEPPTCDAGGDYVVECQGSGTWLLLDGSGSSDPEQDALSYYWTVDCADATLDDPDSPTPVLAFSVVSPCQTACTVTLEVSDGVNPPVSCDAVVTVVDTTPPAIACPPDVVIVVGEASDPDAIGIAEVDDCDPNVDLAYWDTEALSDCPADSVFKTVTRTWVATDGCGNSSSCEQTITVLKLVLPLDVKPGECPNTFNPRGKAYLSVAILGTPEFDAGQIDLASLRLGPGDCVGEWVEPNEGPPGPSTTIGDVGTPLGYDPCACHSDELDGFDDVVLRFGAEALAAAVDLFSCEAGVAVEIVVSGTIDAPGTPFDGAPFIAVDCVEVVGGGRGKGK